MVRSLLHFAASLASVAAFMDGTVQSPAGVGGTGDMPIVKLDGSATGAVCLDGAC